MNGERLPKGGAHQVPYEGLADQDSASELLAAALAYAGRGWPVFPLVPGGKTPVIRKAHPEDARLQRECRRRCGRDGHGLYDATTDPDQIKAWWDRWAEANIGLRTGAPSGLVVLDIDGAQGVVSLHELESVHGRTPATLGAFTPRGRHLYFAHPGRPVNNSAAQLGAGLDVRGDGGYVVAPPSRRPDGSYAFQDAEAEVAPLDAWAEVLGASTAPERPTPADRPSATLPGVADPGDLFTRGEAEARIRPALEALRVAEVGSINVRLNTAAATLSHFVPAFFTEDEAAGMLLEALEPTAYDGRTWKAETTIASGLHPADDWKAVLNEDQAEAEAEPEAPDRLRAEALARIVDLRPYLDGTYVPPEPSVGAARDDGRPVLYPGRWHTVIALTAAGKSWFALWHAYAVLMAGGVVVYLHFEEASPALMLGRLEALGCPAEVIAERFVWLDCSTRWKAGLYPAILEILGEPPGLVVLDGINAACSQHGWPVNEPTGVGAYRAAFVLPATSRGVAVLSLGHPPKAPDRQTERHGFGSTAWLDEADGVGFRLEATKTPIRRGHRGASRLCSVKDRDGQVERHGEPVATRDGWYNLGLFVLHDSGLSLRTTAELLTPTAQAAETSDPLEALADAVVGYLEAHGGRFESLAELRDGLRAAKVKHDDRDLRPALTLLTDRGRLEWPSVPGGRRRPGWLVPSTEVRSEEAGD